MENRKFYDEAFAEIFSNRKIIQSLLEDFVGESWVKTIDFSTMTVKKSLFKGIQESRKESDLLIRFSHDLEIYILIEFQRKPDDMSLRLLEYLHRIYRKNYKQAKKEKRKLAPVVPIVIYNGSAPWSEAPQFLKHFQLPTDHALNRSPDLEPGTPPEKPRENAL